MIVEQGWLWETLAAACPNLEGAPTERGAIPVETSVFSGSVTVGLDLGGEHSLWVILFHSDTDLNGGGFVERSTLASIRTIGELDQLLYEKLWLGEGGLRAKVLVDMMEEGSK